MLAFLMLVLPVFGVVGLGWGAVRAGLAGGGAIEALGLFSFRFALPALVLRLMATQPLATTFNRSFYAGYLATGGAVFALVLAFSRVAGRKRCRLASAEATSATVGNLGFLGPPLMLTFFGNRGVGPLGMAILAEVMCWLSVGSLMMGISVGPSRAVPAQLLRGTLLNPVIAAIALGAILAAAGVRLPLPLDRFAAFLGNAAGPAALFAIGGSLALQRIDAGLALQAAVATVAKLVVYPVLAWCILTRVPNLDPFWARAGTVLASLPSAGSNYLVAQRYSARSEAVSAIVVLSTAFSVATVPIVAWLALA